MLLIGNFEELQGILRLRSWRLAERFTGGRAQEFDDWFCWVQKEVMPTLASEEQRELKILAVFAGWFFCLRKSVAAQVEYPGSAAPVFEFLTVTPTKLRFADKVIVDPQGASPPPASLAPPAPLETKKKETKAQLSAPVSETLIPTPTLEP